MLQEWKKSKPFLLDVPSHALQQGLIELDKAIRKPFDKKSPKRFSKFKKKYR
jgi:transposase